jgi:hypothetical protein
MANFPEPAYMMDVLSIRAIHPLCDLFNDPFMSTQQTSFITVEVSTHSIRNVIQVNILPYGIGHSDILYLANYTDLGLGRYSEYA